LRITGLPDMLPLVKLQDDHDAVLSPPLRKERKHGRFGYGITLWQKIG